MRFFMAPVAVVLMAASINFASAQTSQVPITGIASKGRHENGAACYLNPHTRKMNNPDRCCPPDQLAWGCPLPKSMEKAGGAPTTHTEEYCADSGRDPQLHGPRVHLTSPDLGQKISLQHPHVKKRIARSTERAYEKNYGQPRPIAHRCRPLHKGGFHVGNPYRTMHK